MEKNRRGVRKGTWAKEEDILLRQCIEKYGEGKWHQVPLRAGLNRCRKSCRLRWLNYLRPNIKRGCFSRDEVDLIVRLHKLLGNKWTLIAGRIPERTANDIKNFWNTHISKINSTAVIGDRHEKRNVRKLKNVTTESNFIIKPQPRTLSKFHEIILSSKEVRKTDKLISNARVTDEKHDNKQKSISSCEKAAALLSQDDQLPVNQNILWWSKLLETTENGESVNTFFEVQPTGDQTSSDQLHGDDHVFSIDDLHIWDILSIEDQ